MDAEPRYYVAVIGAGPAGLFAARQLADRNIHTILFNRDIRPGGLAEYGIYLNKFRMKEGLRNQFRQIIGLDDIEYYGNVIVGENGDLSLDQIRALGFHALLVTVGAQSTKRLGIPGEDLLGVYHAKDIVYHYNLLPPFSEATYQIGKRVAVVGVGNVMMDIARWLIEEKHVEHVVAVARRGPAEVKFDKKELESIASYLDMADLELELERVSPAMQAVGQDAAGFRGLIQEALAKSRMHQLNGCGSSSFHMRFLSSPRSIIGDGNRQVTGLEVEENILLLSEDGESRPKGTGSLSTLAVDTVIFAIGDVVDSSLGLPVQYGEFVKNPQPRYPIDGVSYEAFNPVTGEPLADTFLAGWARRPSTGLVGVARKDATSAAQAVIQYLQTQAATTAPVSEGVSAALRQLKHPVVDKPGLQRLEALEREKARELGLEFFKFSTNQQMFDALEFLSREQQP